MPPALQARDPFDPGPARSWLPWGVLAPFLGLAFVIASQFAGVPLIEPLVRMDRYGNPLDAYSLFAYTLVPFGLLAAIVLLWVR